VKQIKDFEIGRKHKKLAELTPITKEQIKAGLA